MTANGRTSRAGYGARHQRLRRELAPLVDAGMMRCGRCGDRIRPGTPWQLDHLDHPLAHQLGLYRANPASHRRCNIASAQGRPPRHRNRGPTAAELFFNTKPVVRQHESSPAPDGNHPNMIDEVMPW